MKNSDRDRFDGRLMNASQAKRNKLEQFKAAANDPKRLAERARRDELAAAREVVRQAKAAKQLQEKEDRERLKAEEAKQVDEKAAVKKMALAAGLAMAVDQVAAKTKAREAERKAERDRRYAARQNRKQ
jgi:hypothetical protein